MGLLQNGWQWEQEPILVEAIAPDYIAPADLSGVAAGGYYGPIATAEPQVADAPTSGISSGSFLDSLLGIAQALPGVSQVIQTVRGVISSVGQLFGGAGPVAATAPVPGFRQPWSSLGIEESVGSISGVYGMIPTGGIQVSTGGLAPYPGPGLPAPTPGGRIAQWVLYLAMRYGAQIAQTVWNLYQELRLRGLSDATAKKTAKAMVGVPSRGRRRMNPLNVRALRRSIRRVRSFNRISGKAQRSMPTRHHHHHGGYRKRRRRGDLSPFYAEDQAEYADTMEDLGYDPGSFRDAEEEDVE